MRGGTERCYQGREVFTWQIRVCDYQFCGGISCNEFAAAADMFFSNNGDLKLRSVVF
jgi:hypothetical protein